MHILTYLGARVTLSPDIDMPQILHPERGALASLIQEALDDPKLEPWDNNTDPIHTAIVSKSLYTMAVPIGDLSQVVWGIHRAHQEEELSPFTARLQFAERTNRLTVELSGSMQRPKLMRAYFGWYTPPLPWMPEAEDADGGVEACFEYWRRHAYLDQHRRLIKRGSLTRQAPEWFHQS